MSVRRAVLRVGDAAAHAVPQTARAEEVMPKENVFSSSTLLTVLACLIMVVHEYRRNMR